MTVSETSALLTNRDDAEAAYGYVSQTTSIASLSLRQPLCAVATLILSLIGTVLIADPHRTSLSIGSLVNNLPIEGKSKKNKSAQELNECEADTKYSKHTVKTAYELPFAALFEDNKGQKKFEASSVTIVGSSVYSVCDSSFAISKFDDSLSPFSIDNKQIGSPERDGDVESGYEGIFHHDGCFYVVRESVLHHNHGEDDDTVNDKEEGVSEVDENHTYHAIIDELLLGEDDYTVRDQCRCEFEFEGSSKGFEGALGFPDVHGELYILGLCEGNHCSEERKADAGNGRMVLMRKRVGEDIPGGCVWETVRIIHIPKSAYFIDYSDIDISDDGRVAISSQENSALWIGKAIGIEHGIISPDSFAFADESETLQFPKSSDCHTVYCNIEGIHWINDEMLLGVSDKMKGHGKQDYRCFDKDQSIHAFVLP